MTRNEAGRGESEGVMAVSAERRIAVAAAPARAAAGFETVRALLFVLILAWAPLPFGSDRAWAWSLLGLMVALLLTASGVTALLRAGDLPAAELRPLRVPLALGALLILWVLVQDRPGGILLWHHPLWDAAAAVLGPDLRPSLSVDREASTSHLFRLLAYGGVFLLAWQAARRREGAALLVKSLALVGTLYALYGIAEFAAPHPAILWFRKWAYDADVTSTFVNRNSFATYAGLTVLANLALLAATFRRNTDAASRRALMLSVADTILRRGRWRVLGLICAGPALLLSHSRGGVLATLCGILTFLALYRAARSLRSPGRRPFGWAAGVGAILAFALAGSGVLARFLAADPAEDGRMVIYAHLLRAIGDNLVAGTGLGSFPFIYPMYEPRNAVSLVDLAHNDWLENLLDLGLPGAALLFALLALLAGRCVRGVFRRRRDALYPCLGAAASLLVGLHAMVDFSLQIPAVSVTYAALLGIGVGQSARSGDWERMTGGAA